jgi:hypothetical protein
MPLDLWQRNCAPGIRHGTRWTGGPGMSHRGVFDGHEMMPRVRRQLLEAALDT